MMEEPVSGLRGTESRESPDPGTRDKESLSSDSSVDLAAWVHALIALPCINCGDQHGGVFEVEDGPGPFCEECWDRLEDHFKVALEAALAAAPQLVSAPTVAELSRSSSAPVKPSVPNGGDSGHLVVEHIVDHWCIQGGQAQFGELGTPQNADELVSAILDRVRAALATPPDEDAEPDDPIGEPWTDAQMTAMRAMALKADVRSARELLERNGFTVDAALAAAPQDVPERLSPRERARKCLTVLAYEGGTTIRLSGLTLTDMRIDLEQIVADAIADAEAAALAAALAPNSEKE